MADRSYVQLHAHSASSFDARTDPRKMVDRAIELGFTHLAITDHDKIEGVLRARDHAGDRIRVIVGQEVSSPDGDLIALYVEQVIPPGLRALDAAESIHEQGGLVGLPHPFDGLRSSGGSQADDSDAVLDRLASVVDYVEVHNARAYGAANPKAAEFAKAHGLPGVAVSDAHSLRELGVAGTIVPGDFSTAAELRELLPQAELMTGRAPYYVRVWTPVAKFINRLQGKGRVRTTRA